MLQEKTRKQVQTQAQNVLTVVVHKSSASLFSTVDKDVITAMFFVTHQKAREDVMRANEFPSYNCLLCVCVCHRELHTQSFCVYFLLV
jgi:hypothetical protein